MLDIIRKKPVALIPLIGVLFLLTQVTTLAGSSGAAAAQGSVAKLGVIQAILVALGYWWTNSAFNGNLGFNVFRWPLMSGTVVGLIMGDLGQGILIGASINLVFLGVIAAGGSTPADPSLAGWLGTALAMSAGLGKEEAIAIAAPLGVIGLLGYFSRMSVDVTFVHWADEAAERGDIAGVARANLIPGQVFVFLTTFIPVVILALAGSTALNALFDAIDPWRGGSADWRWIRDGLIIAGSVLTSVGVAVNLSLILNRTTVPYFVVFFTVAALSNVSIVAMAVVATALAMLHITLTRGGQDVPAASA